MSNMLVIAKMAKAKHSRDSAAANAAKHRRKEKIERDDDSTSTYYSPGAQYKEYVKQELSQDKELGKFFERLDTIAQEIALEDTAPIMVDTEQLLAQKAEALKSVDEATEKLKESMPVKTFEAMGHIYPSYNGLELTTEMLEDPSKAYFRELYERSHRVNESNLSEKEQTYPGEIEKLERKMRFMPWKKDEYQKMIDAMKRELQTARELRAGEARYLADVEKFESLTPEDRKKILEHRKTIDKYNTIGDKLRENEQKALGIRNSATGICYTKDQVEAYRDIHSRALGRMLESKEISPEELDTIFEKLDKIKEKYEQNKYQSNGVMRTKRDEKLDPLVTWFVEDVYSQESEKLTQKQNETGAEL